MRVIKKLSRALFLTILALGIAVSSAVAAGGSGQSVPVLSEIAISSIGSDSAVATFTYDSNIGAKGSENTRFFYAEDSAGNAVSVTAKYWSDSKDDRKREFELQLSGLTPGSTYTVGAEPGVVANNGQSSASSGTCAFTTLSASSSAPAEPLSGGNIPTWTGDGQPSPGTAGRAVIVSGSAPEPGEGGGDGGGQEQPLVVVASTPKDGARDVSVDTEIVLEFSKNVVYLAVRDINKAAVTLWDGKAEVPAEIVMADEQLEPDQRNFITIRPLEPLEESKEYTVRVNDSIVSKSGAKLADPAKIVFSTPGYSQGIPWHYVAAAVGLVFLLGIGTSYIRSARSDSELDISGSGLDE